MKDLKNKVIWITGASSGIGEALAYEFAREGALLVLSARNRAKLEEVRDRCLQHTSQCWLQPADLSKTDEVPALVDSVIGQAGRIDFLINNAGRSQRSLAKDTPVAIDREVMELNFFSIITLSKQVLQQMLKQGSGHVVVISSITGKFGFPWRTAYSASKHALQGYFEALRAELVNEHIDVTIVSPGRINTNVSKNAITESGQSYNKMDDGQATGMPADECAAQIVKAVKKNKKEILVGRKELLMVYIRRFFPALFYKMVIKIKN